MAALPILCDWAHHEHRKPRSHYKPEQKELLEATYQESHRPSPQAKRNLAAETGLTYKQVKVWLEDRRRKDKVGKRKGRSVGPLEKTTEKQEATLTKAFNLCAFPAAAERRDLAEHLGLNEHTVYVWFRRHRYRRASANKKWVLKYT